MTSYYLALARGAEITRILLVDLGLGFIFIEALRHYTRSFHVAAQKYRAYSIYCAQ